MVVLLDGGTVAVDGGTISVRTTPGVVMRDATGAFVGVLMGSQVFLSVGCAARLITMAPAPYFVSGDGLFHPRYYTSTDCTGQAYVEGTVGAGGVLNTSCLDTDPSGGGSLWALDQPLNSVANPVPMNSTASGAASCSHIQPTSIFPLPIHQVFPPTLVPPLTFGIE